LHVIELAGQPLEVANAVIVTVEEGLDVQLVDDRVLVPQRVVGAGQDQRSRPRQHGGSVIGGSHVSMGGRSRNTRAGCAWGSSVMWWRSPPQDTIWPVNASSKRCSRSPARPSSDSGRTTSAAWVLCGARLT